MRPSSSPSELFGGVFTHGRAAGLAGDRAWLQALLDVEAGIIRALERAGLAPRGSGAAVTAAARAERFDPADLGRAAAGPGNPVPPLVRQLTAAVPGEYASAVHHGAKNQDILDSALMLVATRVRAPLLEDLAAAADGAATLARRHRDTIMAGRTLLQQAVPVTFGLVAAGWLSELDMARSELARFIPAAQFGGAAGTLAALGERGAEVAGLFAEELGLAEPVLPWHTGRLRMVDLAARLAGVAAVLGKIARDVTLLAQTEVAEVREPSAPGRGGSSTMPHKRNPVAAVSVLACTRRVPGLLATLSASAEQELQRAAGAWHAEWETMSDLLRLTGSAAAWTAETLPGLEVDVERMRRNVEASAVTLAERLATRLAPALGRLAAQDMVAEAVEAVVRAAAGDRTDDGSRTARGRGGLTLADAVLADPGRRDRLAAAGVREEDVRAVLDPAGYVGSAGVFVDRALAAHRRGHRETAPSSERRIEG